MTSKTFESIDQTRQLQVKDLNKHVTLVIEYKDAGRSGLTIAQSDAPALALAILEAAGVEPVDHSVTGLGRPNWLEGIAHGLKLHIEHEDKCTAEAEAQAKLEAEALELLNVVREARGIKPHLTAGEASPEAMNEWLAVARRAREMRAEK